MSFLRTFFSLADYSDQQIAAAAANYYGCTSAEEEAFDDGINFGNSQISETHESADAEHDETGNKKQETASNAYCDTCAYAIVPEVSEAKVEEATKPEPEKNRKRKEAPRTADHKVGGFDVNAFVLCHFNTPCRMPSHFRT